MRLVELDRITDGDWRQVIAGEHEPWGGGGEALQWREKSRNLGLCDDAGNLVALAGLVLAEVRVADAPLQVAGIGGVIVTRSARGHGFARTLIERLLEIAHELDAERAMLFCLPANIGLYAKFGFQLIEEPVWAVQPGGLIEMPLRAMWMALTPAASWPEGKIELLDEPF
ncbi:MAG TPA: GNAT family N-acetyltransferase [Solirubrobacteraceae bacterium]|jgi:GNAT superfamily N-acetyltransferase|nr:GNAT family N-acetyltransferase [Solirubrobacteraceae bacterium]